LIFFVLEFQNFTLFIYLILYNKSRIFIYVSINANKDRGGGGSPESSKWDCLLSVNEIKNRSFWRLFFKGLRPPQRRKD